MKNILQMTEPLTNKLLEIRKELHQHPEVSGEEYETTRRIKQWLTDAGCRILPINTQTGAVAEVSGNKEGPTVAFRADIDALPIPEQTGLPYSSKNENAFHGCGHDWHTTIALGAAMVLSQIRDQFAGHVRFIFQPAEETTQGAKALIDHGLFQDGKIQGIFGLHNQPSIPAGKVGITEHRLMAAVDTLHITIKGKSGHGAIPHQNIDAVVAGSAVVMGLQTAVSRNIDPFEPVVITIGSFHSGTAHNVIAGTAELWGTVRSFNPDVRKQLPELIQRISVDIAAGCGAEAKAEIIPQVPAIQNDAEMTSIVKKAAQSVMGKDSIVKPEPTMGGEDFSLYQEHVPGCYFWVGTGDPMKSIDKPWHDPAFLVNDELIPDTVRLVAEILLTSLKHFQTFTKGEVNHDANLL
ncbi:amidohydrolase [Melghiribacillus thermohalophilus]|uniref:Amidohydrolase n=1 Tax=Melghiribacillus thermohalophilus TaxID=1324956 RepID=A0A4R3NAK4_9BACI|nr:M20 family metallopeptidase [Melghiribacillus thermohalophilus]TCT26492.1 amidohydrolase [Melghiribacillus thermohalophilus]